MLEADAQAAAMGSMGAGLAHELKTPLSTIDINLQLLQEEWANPVSEREVRSAKRLQVIARSVAKMNEIIRSFVRFAQDKPLDLRPVELHQLAQDIVSSELGEIIRNRDRIDKVHVTCDLKPCSAQADEVLIRQSILNLLINAVEAIPGKGTVALRTWMEGDRALISVSDTGQGIAPENMEKIWNLYFTTKPSGIGMGLPIVKRFVEAHGGTVRGESRPGKGSTFSLSIPVRHG